MTVSPYRAAVATIAGLAGVALAVGGALMPTDTIDSVGSATAARKVLERSSTTAAGPYVGLWITCFGLLATGVAVAAALALVRGRGRACTAIGTVLTAVGLLGEVVLTSSSILVRRAVAFGASGPTDPTAARILTKAFFHGAGLGEFIGLSLLLIPGFVLLAIGLQRSKTVPALLAWLLPVGAALAIVFAPEGPVGALFAIPFVVALLGLARRIAQGVPTDPLTTPTPAAVPVS